MEKNVQEDWQVYCYESGTQIVKKRTAQMTDGRTAPHLYIHGPRGEDDSQRVRYKTCEQLATYLNGGERPAWLDDFYRSNEETLQHLNGSSITATGPVYDHSPPACNWRQCDDRAAKDARARLIDRLHLRRV